MRRKHAQARSHQFGIAPDETGGNGKCAKRTKRRLVAEFGQRSDTASGGGPPVERGGAGDRKVGPLDRVEAALGLGAG